MRIVWDDDGQATTEYMIILATMVTLALLLITKLIRPAFKMLISSVQNGLDNALFGANLHTFPLGKGRR